MIRLQAEVSRPAAVFRRRYRRLFAILEVSLALALLGVPEVRGQCLGCANASFGPASRAQGTGDVLAMKVADFNNDGIPDLAIVGSNVSIYLGDGTGGFSLTSSYTPPFPGNSMAVGDFNGDGKADLAVAWPGGSLYTDQPGEILVFFGDGAGGLSSPVHLSAGFHPTSVVAADFNGDGNLDLASGSWAESAISVLPGDGHGGFAPAVSIPTPSPPTRLAAGDINGDGLSDLAVAMYDGTVHCLLALRSGAFQDVSSIALDRMPASDLLLADFNGDGRLDVAATAPSSKLSILLGHGDGTFDPPASVSTGGVLAAADFNGDGRLDLIAGDSLYLGDGFGGFSFASSFPGFVPSVAGDFDGDGLMDVASALNSFGVSSEVIVSFGTGDGHFREPAKFPLAKFPSRGLSIDLNADGKPDVLILDTSGNLTALLGDGAGGFGPPVTTALTLTGSFDLVVGDFDEDGFPDVVLYGYENPYGYSLIFLHGDGAGHFGPPVRTPAVAGFGLAAGDFNGDHHLDIALGNYGPLNLFFGDGTGHFGPATLSVSLPEPGSLVAADLNKDGKLDLVLFGVNTRRIVTLLGDGHGGFVTGVDLTGAFYTAFLVADFNGDGIPDLAAVSYKTLSVRTGDGKGGFADPVNLALPLPASQLFGADFDGDGKLDLLVGETILRGDGAGGFSTATSISYVLPGTVIAAADFTGDGKPDLVGWSDSDPSLWLLVNTRCEPRRLRLAREIPSCGTAELPFAVQPIVRVEDDGGNLVTCDSGQMAASILPGTGTAGAQLGGTTTVAAAGGVASFSDLSIDLPGRGYRVVFTRPPARPATSRTITQSLSPPTISGAANTCTVGSSRFDGGGGYDSYRWTLDGAVVGGSRFVTVGPLAVGTHTLQLTVSQDGCQATGAVSLATTASPPAPAVSNNGPVPFAGTLQLSAASAQGATYQWSGPNLFSSSLQNPSVANATPLNSGRYRVVASAGGCASEPAATDVVVLPAPLCGGCAKASFESAARALPVADDLAGLVLADFDRDGIPDIVVAHGGFTNEISFLRGDGRGGFAPAVVSPFTVTNLATGVRSLAAADLNGDGFLDVVGRAYTGVVVALGTPSGKFGPAATYPTGSDVSDVAISDVNGDGFPDLVAANRGSNTVSVLFGSASGTFGSPVTVAVEASPSAILVRDFDGDGRPDIAVASGETNSVSFLPGDGKGGFAPSTSLSVPGVPFALAFGDVTGDGYPDLVVGLTSGGDQLLAIFQGNSHGGFTFLRSFTVSLTGPIVVADVNGDGRSDLVTLGADGISVRLSRGGGLFDPVRKFFAGSVNFPGPTPVTFVVGDFNGDGLPDIVAGSGPDPTAGLSPIPSLVALLAGDGRGGFTQLPGFGIGVSDTLTDQLAVADLNHDGHPDLLISRGEPIVSRVSVSLADGHGGFLPPTDVQPPPPFPMNAFTLGDVNGDGIADLVELDHYDGKVFVFPGNGDGSFRAPVVTSVGRSFSFIGAGDLNGDGRLDLLISNDFYIGSPGISLLLGNSGFGFGAPLVVDGSVQALAVAIADFNGDGKADIAVAKGGARAVVVYPGNGLGGFGPPVTSSLDAYPKRIVAADFDGDGKVDVVVGSQVQPYNFSLESGLRFLPGNGAGGFGASRAFGFAPDAEWVARNPGDLVVADFNGDGKLDVAAALPALGLVEVMMGDGLGGFAAPVQYLAGSNDEHLAAADLDGDGRTDLVAPDVFPAAVRLLFNTNCVPTRLGVTATPACPLPGQAFPNQPVVKVFDDGDNVVACDGRPVTASIVPGTGTPGASLAGVTTVNAASGVASFSNLSIDLAGISYELEFHHPLASAARSAPFSVGTIPPAPAASSNGPICVHETLQLSASSVPGAIYRWTGPNGFSSGLQNPSIPNASVQASGTYSVTVTVNGCTSAPATTAVTVNATPAPTASNNGPICAGQTLQLSASDIAGATYAWTGPSGFASTEQNPQILSAPLSASGKYFVVATANTCPSPAASTTVAVRALPSAAISAAATVCANSLNTASVPAIAGATYSWTIVNGTITAGAGTSTITFMAGPSGSVELGVTVTSANGCSATGSKSVSIVSGPSCPGFYTVTPCRVIDTRDPDGPLAGPPLSGGTQRSFVLAEACGIPATAKAVSVNVAVTQAAGSGHLMIYPGGASPPDVSVMNFSASDTRSNNAILVLGSSGDITVYTAIGSGLQVDFILDVNGYFQ